MIVRNVIVCNRTLVSSTSANLYFKFLISLDIHNTFPTVLTESLDDDRFVELQSLNIFIHDGAELSIEYIAKQGTGYRLPRIKNHRIKETIDE